MASSKARALMKQDKEDARAERTRGQRGREAIFNLQESVSTFKHQSILLEQYMTDMSLGALSGGIFNAAFKTSRIFR